MKLKRKTIINSMLKKSLSAHPKELLDINNAYRTPYAEGGLWHLDEVSSAGEDAMYPALVTTVVPTDWKLVGPDLPVSLEKFHEIYELTYPKVLKLIKASPYLVIAGGSVASAINGGNVATDADFFVVGAPRELRWKVVHDLATAVLMEYADRLVSEEISHGVVTWIVGEKKPTDGRFRTSCHRKHPYASSQIKIQLVLREYNTLSACLHGFDIPASAVAYTREGSVVMTSCAAYAHVFKINLVNPQWRSPTYEYRLAKYFKRGYGLALVDASPDIFAGPLTASESAPESAALESAALESAALGSAPSLALGSAPSLELPLEDSRSTGTTGGDSDSDAGAGPGISFPPPTKKVVLPKITIEVFGSIKGFAIGLVSVNAAPEKTSDYEPEYRYNTQDRMGSIQSWINMSMLYKEPLSMTIFNPVLWKVSNYLDWETQSPRVQDILDERMLNVICKAVNNSIRKRHVPLNSMMHFLKCTPDQVANIARDIARGVYPAELSSILDRLRARYSEVKNEKPQWWVVPGSGPHTASMNPCEEMPEQWYGPHCIIGPTTWPTEQTVTRQMSIVRLMGDQPKNICPICMGKVTFSEINIITLSCGHAAHWKKTAACDGIKDWLMRSRSCPMCRCESP